MSICFVVFKNTYLNTSSQKFLNKSEKIIRGLLATCVTDSKY